MSNEHAPQRTDVWASHATHTLVNYSIVAEAEADLLCRVLNHFAQQFLIPQQVSVIQQDQLLFIEVRQGQLSWHRAGVIAAKLRSLVSVCSVQLDLVESADLVAAGSFNGAESQMAGAAH